jgi:hypothetical protein
MCRVLHFQVFDPFRSVLHPYVMYMIPPTDKELLMARCQQKETVLTHHIFPFPVCIHTPITDKELLMAKRKEEEQEKMRNIEFRKREKEELERAKEEMRRKLEEDRKERRRR